MKFSEITSLCSKAVSFTDTVAIAFAFAQRYHGEPG
jgi:hypothetical protein